MLIFRRLLLVLRRMAAPWALGYLALWAITLAPLQTGGQLKRTLSCTVDPQAPLPLWTCGESLVSTLAGLVVSAALVTIVWSLFLVAAAVAHLDALLLAILTFGTHLAGLPGIFVLIVRAARRLGRGIRAV